MNQEDINDLMWKSMADWQKNVAIDGGNLYAAKRRIKELEAQLEQLQNTSSNSDYTKSKSCANCDKLYQCGDVRKHPEWHCEKHDFA